MSRASKRATQARSFRKRQSLLEKLEDRHLLAADFIVDESGKDLELQISGSSIQVLDTSDNSVIKQEAINNIDNKKVEITAKSLLVDSDVSLDGNSLVVNAVSVLLSGAGAINTSDLNASGNSEGDSGDISLTAQTITIGAQSVTSNVVGGGNFEAGKITLAAEDMPTIAESVFTDTFLPRVAVNRTAAITLNGTNISGGDVTIKADGASSSRWDDIGGFGDDIGKELIGKLQALPQFAESSFLPVSGQAKVHDASATISLTNAVINSSTQVTIGAKAEADASVNSVALSGNSNTGPVLVAVAFSGSESTAKVDLLGNTQVTAAGSVEVTTDATSKAEVSSRSDANAVGDSNNTEVAFNAALALTEETSTIVLEQNASITSGGIVTLDATGEVTNEVAASTTVFDDGFGGLSVAVGYDEANIKSEVKGTITANGGSGDRTLEFAAADIDAAGNQITLDNIPESDPIKVGEKLTYDSSSVEDGDQADTGLIDGRTYIVREASDPTPAGNGMVSQTLRIVSAAGVDLDSRQVQPGSQHTLTKLASIKFQPTDVRGQNGTADGLVRLTDLPATVTRLTYLGPDFADGEDPDSTELQLIDGLVQGQEYEVTHVAGNQVKLKLPGATDFIDFVAPANGVHGFYYTEALQTFDASTAVDNVLDAVQLPAGHGFKTGDLVFYETDATKVITRALSDYGDELGDAPNVLGNLNLPNSPIHGLENNLGYRAIIDDHLPNQIRFATSLIGAASAGVFDLLASSSDDHMFHREKGHDGIKIDANLEASNQADAGIQLSDKDDQPTPSLGADALGGDIDKVVAGGSALIDVFRKNEKTVDDAKMKTGTESKTGQGLDAAGSVAVAIFDHDVQAIVASTATLKSQDDIDVNAEIEQIVKVGSASEATRKGTVKDDTSGDKLEITAAIGVGIYDNDAQAIIADNATVDAAKELSVTSKIDYPMMLDSVTDAINPITTLEENGLSGFESINDGLMGLSQLFNVQTKALAGSGADSVALGAAIVVTDFTNNVVARIGDNAQVNQDPSVASNDQSVSVDTTLEAVLIDVGQMSAINLSVPGLLEAFQNNKTPSGEKFKPKQIKDFFTEIVNPFGIAGKNAAGGVLLLALADNTTIAEIEQGAAIHTDAGGVSVKATSDFHNVAVVQTGTASTNFGFSAAIAAADFDSTTRASVAPGVSIDGGTLNVNAEDTLDRINIVGAFLRGKQVGIGASVGVNIVDQNVSAFIGRADTTADAAIPGTFNIAIAGPTTINAKSNGDIFSLVMAGAAQGFGGSDDSEGQATTSANSKQTNAVALTVPVAYNQVNGDVKAYLDNEAINTNDLTISAESNLDLQAIAVGASFAVQTSSNGGGSKLDLAGAGAVTINNVQQGAAAFIRDSNINAGGNVRVTAADNSEVEADAGGFGIALSRGQSGAALSFGVSVAINDLTSNISALIDNSTMVASGVSVLATANTDVDSLSIAGALSARQGQGGTTGSLGAAGAGSQNSVANTVTANITDSTVTANTDGITIRATDSTDVNADAGGFAIAAALGSGRTTLSGAIGIGIALNDIDNTATAAITESMVTAEGTITVDANTDAAKIDALTIAATVGVAGGSGLSATLSGAGAGTENDINSTISATINGGNVTSNNGNVDVKASDNATINSLTIGASLAVAAGSGQGGAITVGVSIAFNEINNQVTASLSNTTVTATGGNVDVQASDSATIDAMSVAASLSLAGTGGSSLNLTGGGSVANNVILNDSNATIQRSTVNAGGTVSVATQSTSDVDAEVYGVFVGGSGSGSSAGTAAIGIALAENYIGFDRSETLQSSDALATVSNSAIVAGGLNVRSTANQTIDATTVVGAAAVAVAADGALAAQARARFQET